MRLWRKARGQQYRENCILVLKFNQNVVFSLEKKKSRTWYHKFENVQKWVAERKIISLFTFAKRNNDKIMI